ncbi:hypothetical protein I316_06672 [Kwoniella heveanensis BCC8398]|uniref:IPT/TIG domain-containing protein n=1 Tax=Kwoniella heveanensis BCC8398 TaxID=1296120 RepID=A0A1B9GKZ4_9TREE|nr:hypothetical protein I316_06672 [Kwoniella heveanensis BCC8398]
MPVDSSSASASSPFSARSTSSPEGLVNGGEGSSANPNLPRHGQVNGHGHGHGHHGFQHRGPSQDLMQGMQAILNSFAGSAYPNPAADFITSQFSSPAPAPSPQRDVKPHVSPSHTSQPPPSQSQPQFQPQTLSTQPEEEAKPFHSIPPPSAGPSRTSVPPPQPENPQNPTTAQLQKSVQSSATGSHSHGGLRSDPPKRMYEVDDLSKVTPSLDEITSGSSTRNQLILQGDPLFSDKSRVETAIRVIIDILRFAPMPTPPPSIHSSLHPLLPRDPNGNLLMTLERIASFHGLRLQAGTTTKASSKKQLQAGPIPKENLVYVETAVYMSGENGRRVYVCKRCRNREARRRASKEVNRKRQPNSDSDTSSSQPKHRRSLVPPSQDFITAENPDQYDPHRSSQVIEEPPWDPEHRDWRHEIVLFNSPPEVKMEDGSCNWLPFRVVCYGKCHGEKVGFKIKFTLRTWDGRVIATSTTKPIRITDDHKTEPKTKTKVDGATSSSAQPAVPRARKGRQSTASSRRQSPAPSETESVQSFSEAGAVLQKQTRSVRAGKPYERPPTQSPAMATIPMDNYMPSGFQRQSSTTSLQSLQQQDVMSQPSVQQQQPQQQPSSMDFSMQQHANTVSPGILRGPQFSLGHLDLQNALQQQQNAPLSLPPSNVTSPSSQALSLNGQNDMLFGNPLQSPNDFMSALGLSGAQQQQQQHSQQPLMFSHDSTDIEMSSAMTGGLDDIFANSSHTSVSSVDDQGSVFSGFGEDRSSAMFSDSGLPPATTTDIDQFLDYTGGEHQDVSNPFQPDLSMPHISPPSSASQIPGLSFDNLHLSPMANTMDLSPAARAQQDASIRDMLAAIAQLPPQPTITHVIPGDGPMAGGTKIAIAGRQFQPGMVVVFGQRPAPTEFVSDGFVQCKLPPSSFPGEVEVVVQGAVKVPGSAPQLFRYNNMDKDLMRLALEVRNQYNGSSSDAAYRLAHHVATRSATGSEWSERSSSNSPMSGPSPGDNVEQDEEDDRSDSTDGEEAKDNGSALQSTIISFLASIDENAPGSLRASGAINHRNEAQQTLLHIATVMGFHRLVRRLIVVGAHLDVQDVNGYTPLAFAALCGRHTCARVLIEAGASYDRPTAYGEMPLDLAKYSEHAKVEALLLSAVWSTSTESKEVEGELEVASSRSFGTSGASEIDDDNPSSGSEVEDEVDHLEKMRISRRRSRRSLAKGKSKQRTMSIKSERELEITSLQSTRRPSLTSSSTETTTQPPHQTPAITSPLPPDDPPPYAPTENDGSNPSWMSRTLSTIPHPHHNFKLPEAVWDRLPIPQSIFSPEKDASATASAPAPGWVAFPAPSWETLQKMASPEEVKLFTQAMAAAAFNAVVQSGMTTANVTSSSTGGASRSVRGAHEDGEMEECKRLRRRRKSNGGNGTTSGGKDGRRSGDVSPSEKMVKHVKQDRMLYLFWLPILLFVGFWLLVTALPIATGFCLIYARQITRAIKQRVLK